MIEGTKWMNLNKHVRQRGGGIGEDIVSPICPTPKGMF
jgi:hypothetical protein